MGIDIRKLLLPMFTVMTKTDFFFFWFGGKPPLKFKKLSRETKMTLCAYRPPTVDPILIFWFVSRLVIKQRT